MSENERRLALFTLCKSLVDLLGEEQAIADLQILLERHPEMFKDKEEVKTLTQKVINEPDIIIKNPTPMSERDFILGKKLNGKKMGEVGIRKDENINKIFHANEKRLKNLELMSKKNIIVDGRDALTPYTQAQSLDGRLVQKNISSTTGEIISQKNNNEESQTEALVNQMLQKQESINAMPRAEDFLKDNEIKQNDLGNKQEHKLKQRFRK